MRDIGGGSHFTKWHGVYLADWLYVAVHVAPPLLIVAAVIWWSAA